MPGVNVNGRIQRIEKQVAPSIDDILKLLDKVTYKTPVWFASINSQRGEATPEDDRLVAEFWNDETWQGAKLALDARWPRALWEPEFWDAVYKKQGFKDYLDHFAFELWFCDVDPRAAAQDVLGRSSDDKWEKVELERYGRFRSLPDEEQARWRNIARAEQSARYANGGHAIEAKPIFDKFVAEYNRLIQERES